MNKKQAYEQGKDRGYSIGIEVLSFGNHGNEDDYLEECWLSEDFDRQSSEFSFVAHELNNGRYPEVYWDNFEKGIIAGVNKAWREKNK